MFFFMIENINDDLQEEEYQSYHNKMQQLLKSVTMI